MTDALRCVYCVSDRGWGPFRLRVCVRSPVALDAIFLSPCGLGMVVGIGQRQSFVDLTTLLMRVLLQLGLCVDREASLLGLYRAGCLFGRRAFLGGRLGFYFGA